MPRGPGAPRRREVEDTQVEDSVVEKAPRKRASKGLEVRLEDQERVIASLKAGADELRRELDALKEEEGSHQESFLSQLQSLREHASTIKNKSDLEKQKFLYSVIKHFGYSAWPHADSEARSDVADAMRVIQQEIEEQGQPLPSKISTFDKSKPLLESAAIGGGTLAKGTLGVVEGGTLATFILLLRQELYGETFSFLSPEHLIVTSVIILLTVGPIEFGKLLVSKGIKAVRGKKLTLAGAGAVLVTALSPVVQTHTFTVAIAGAEHSSGFSGEAEKASEGIKEQLRDITLAEGSSVSIIIEKAKEKIPLILETEYLGDKKVGEGGSGKRGMGPSLAYKGGFFLSEKWDTSSFAEKYGKIPQGTTEKAKQIQAEFLAGIEARNSIQDFKGTLDESITLLYGEYAESVKEDLVAVEKGFQELGATVGDVDFWCANPLMVKAALTVGFAPPGAPVVDEKVKNVLRILEKVQDKYAGFTKRVGTLVDSISAVLGQRFVDEAPISIDANPVTFDTSDLQDLKVPAAVSLRDYGSPYQEVAKNWFGSSELVPSLAVGGGFLLIFGGILLYGLPKLRKLLGKEREERLMKEFKEKFGFIVEGDGNYVEQLSVKLSEHLKLIFEKQRGALGSLAVQNQLRNIDASAWVDLSPEMVQVAMLDVFSNLKQVQVTGDRNLIEQIVDIYIQGFGELLSRGVPDEVAAFNAMQELLENQEVFSGRIIEVLFPGYFELESYLKNESEKSNVTPDIGKFDKKFYPVVIAHLEQRMRVEQTRLAWATDSFKAFQEDGEAKDLNIEALEIKDTPPIDLSDPNLSFANTGLSHKSLAGSALRRAAILTIAEHIRDAKKKLGAMHAFAKDLEKTALLEASMHPTDKAIYQKIDRLLEGLSKTEGYDSNVGDHLGAVAPENLLKQTVRDSILRTIHNKMGETETSESDTLEYQEAQRIENQFYALQSAVNRFWFWENRKDQTKSDPLPLKDPRIKAIENGGYEQTAHFVVLPATDEVPAPSYGVRFSIRNTKTGEPVSESHMSLAQTFSRKEIGYKDRIKKIDGIVGIALLNYHDVYVSRILTDRIKNALKEKDEQFDLEKKMTIKPMTFPLPRGSTKVEEYHGTYLLHESSRRYSVETRREFDRIKDKLPDLDHVIDDGDVASDRKIDSVQIENLYAITKKAEFDDYESLKRKPVLTLEHMQTLQKLLAPWNEKHSLDRIEVIIDPNLDAPSVTITRGRILKRTASLSFDALRSYIESSKSADELGKKAFGTR